jgi:hypothetical protein
MFQCSLSVPLKYLENSHVIVTTPLLSNPNILKTLAYVNGISTPHTWVLWVAYIIIAYHFLHQRLMDHHPIHFLEMLQTHPFHLIPLSTIICPCYTMFAIIKMYLLQFLKCYALGDVLGESTLRGATLDQKNVLFYGYILGVIFSIISSSILINI